MKTEGDGGSSPTQLEPHKVVDWTEMTLTSRCNQRCFFCYEDGRDTAREPPLERVKELLRAISEQAEQVVFCGREVLMRRDILEIVGYASSLGLRAVVFTNGQALARPGLVEQLAEAGCSGISMSFHFPDIETFIRGARVKGSCFTRALEGLRRVRDYNLAHAERPLGLSTETDMFVLNAGRLAHMRAVLQEAIDPSPWRMRLASLVPSRVHDIGLGHVLEALDQRREELAEVIATHPPELPLGFVKLPLCILPLEEAHRCLDVQYVYEGTRLTFNHVDNERIEEDPLSGSVGRNIDQLLGQQPYRWLCRGCELVPMCRFERVDWEVQGFAPTREQRPTPFRAAGAETGWWDQVALPRRTGTTAEVLSRLGPKPDGEEWATAVRQALQRRVFPEEEIFAQLAEAGAQEPRLVDLYVDQEPVAVVVLEIDGERIRLQLGLPSAREDERVLGAVVGYLDVRDVTPEASPEARRRCLEHLGRLELPHLSAWATEPWFDPRQARLVQAVWLALGQGGWPALGGFGPWRTEGATLRRDRGLVLELTHHAGHAVALLCFLDHWRAESSTGRPSSLRLRLDLVEASCACPPGDLAELQRELGQAVLGGAGQIRCASPPKKNTPWSVELSEGQWRLHQREQSDSAGRRLMELEPSPGGPPSLRLVVRRRSGGTPQYCFHVAKFVEGQPYLKRQGEFILWYTHARLDDGARAWAKVLLVVMKHLQRCPPSAQTTSRWRHAIQRVADRAALGSHSWEVQWQRGR